MIPISNIDQNFENLWLKFLENNKEASVFYLPLWKNYQRYYSDKTMIEDLSFVLIDNRSAPIAICPLYLEKYKNDLQFSYSGEYSKVLRTPLLCKSLGNKQRKKAEKEVFALIDNLALKKRVSKVHFLIDPLCSIYNDENYNFLTKYGYIDSSISTQLYFLNQSINQLREGIRKSYTSIINKADRLYDTVFIDYSCPNFNIHEEYRHLHKKAAGRITRSIDTFNTQFEMLKNDKALLTGVKYKNKIVALSYFAHNHKTAYYMSAADDTDFEAETPLSHLILWKAIEYYHSRKFEYLEFDNQQYGEQIFDHPTEKDVNISLFKKGLGGKTVPLFRGIKYYNKDYMKKDIKGNIDKLIANYKI